MIYEENSAVQDEPAEPRWFAVTSGKGGTGKSIIIASLGALLARCGFRTLLVDADLFTGGLSFYSLASRPRRIRSGLQDVFLRDVSIDQLEPIDISTESTEGNLFLLPSISQTRLRASELHISSKFRDLEEVASKLEQIINRAQRDWHFDYVLVDTRGGSDFTSIASALAARSFIIVTEADKTSWDVGDVLVGSISEAQQLVSRIVLRSGFILNKNVLPPEAIEAFLRRQWECPHLATIPLDEEAIRCFQEDTIPVLAAPSSRFSGAVVPIIRKLFLSDKWPEASKVELARIEAESREFRLRVRSTSGELERADRFSVWLRLYGTLLATALLGFLSITVIERGTSQLLVLMVSVAAAVLIFLMTVSDPRVVKMFLNLFTFRRR
jgi:MinD-like ATPase involved in chromosome partitioning or flagellar assembly